MMPTAPTTREASSPSRAWHALPPDEALRALGSNERGLPEGEAESRYARLGPNAIPPPKKEGLARLLLRQFTDPIVYLLLVSTAIAIALGKLVDGLVVFAAVLVNALIGFVQEVRARQAIEALAQLVPHGATVLRGGRQVSLPARELVPGDVVVLTPGDRVPADARVLAAKNLRVEEAALTGESEPSTKAPDPVEEGAGLGDRRSMAFGGTMVTAGSATAAIVATGAKTELGRISQMLEEATEVQTPLTRALAAVGRRLTVAVVAISLLLFAVSLLRGASMADGLLVAIALAVATIPEGLAAIITIALAIGVQRMARRRAIVRRLPSVETLGSTTVICTDKTGTLTRSEMTVQALWTPHGQYTLAGVGYAPEGKLESGGSTVEHAPSDVRAIALAGVLCSDATLVSGPKGWTITGDPTEAALVVAAEKVGLRADEERQRWKRLDEIPFDSRHQYMATLHRDPEGGARLFVKGAVEAILPRCTLPDHVDADEVLAEMERQARRGLRVLAIAERRCASEQREIQDDDLDSELVLLGLAGMMDPPRPEAIAAVRACQAAGITVKMITGDHLATAEAIGATLSLLEPGGRGLTGADLASLPDDELREATRRTHVFARVAPEHKLRLVRALQEERHVVAMTGDGVNDAPALKQADIGVAMGITGTAVAKEAADIVLADDNFATIASAVEEGRRVYDNLVKSLAFVLPTNLGLGFILMVSVAFFPIVEGGSAPLTPMLPAQLLWVNLVSSVALALPLALETAEPSAMLRPPRRSGDPVLSRFVIGRTFVTAILMCAGAVGMFLWEFNRELPRAGYEVALAEAQTMAITTVISFQIFYLLQCRSLREPLKQIGWLSNPSVFVGIGVLVLLHAGFMYLPFMQTIFRSAPLDLKAIAFSVAIGAIVLPVIGLEKALRARKAT